MSSGLSIDLAFNSAHLLPRVLSSEEIADSKLFKSSPNTGPFQELGVPLSKAVVPTSLIPSNVFWQELGNRLAEVGVPRTKQQPFEVGSRSGSQASMTLSVSLFPPNILLVAAKLRGVRVDPNGFATKLLELQKIDFHPQVLSALSAVVGMASSLDHRDYQPRRPTRIVSAIGLGLVGSAADIVRWVQSHKLELAGVMIIEVDYESMAPSLIDALFLKNEELNVKSAHEFVLIDKQGLLFVGRDIGSDRFRRLARLQALALAFELFLGSYRSNRSEAPAFYDFILSKMARWVQNPDPVFRRSVSTRHAWTLLRDELQLSDDVEEILMGDAGDRLGESRELFDRLGETWWAKENFAEILSKELSNQRGDSRLAFVQDEPLREIIANDLREAEITLAARAYKATMVMAGSVAEAMLLAAILNSPKNSDSEAALLGSGLQELVAKAEALNLVNDLAALKLVDQWLRGYRNLIHPGRQKRKQVEADDRKAAVAIHAVNGLAEELGH